MIRRAVVEDAGRIAEIHVFGWRSAYRGIVSDSYLFGKTSVGKRIESLSRTLSENIEETYVFEEESIVKAFMTIGASRNQDKKNAFELWSIYVDPLLTGKGIGTQMIHYCEDCAKNRAYQENILWVFKDNIKTRKLYENLGYRFDGSELTIEYFNTREIRYSKIL